MNALPTFDGFLARLPRWNIPFESIIDVGASDGRWTRALLEACPGRAALLIDARHEHEPALAAFTASTPRSRHVIAAAADHDGPIHFHAGDLFGGLASHSPFQGHDLVVPGRRLDGLVHEAALPPPFLLKLDTHGFEREILAGATSVLTHTSLAVIEAYNHRMGHDHWLFPELCAAMATLGFRVIDVFDPLYRERDSSLWQADFAFARNDWPGFSHPGYT